MKRTLMIYTITFSAVAAVLVGRSAFAHQAPALRVADGEACVTESGGTGYMVASAGASGELICVAYPDSQPHG
jgi:hypothetical protein